MIQIRPISDLKNNLPDIELATDNGPVYLTKHGHGAFVIMNLETFTQYAGDIDYVSMKLAEADRAAEESDVRLTHEEIFTRLEKFLDELK